MTGDEAERLRVGLIEVRRIIDGHVPGDAELSDAPLLTGWEILAVSSGAITLIGRASGHPLRPDGPVQTSIVLAMSEPAGWARTVSRYYRLGLRRGESLENDEYEAVPTTPELERRHADDMQKRGLERIGGDD